MHAYHPTSSFDVVIAGAGPVGLFLACELRLAGVSVLVLERANNPCSPLKQLPFGLRGLSVPTIEAFYRRGLLDDLVALGQRNANTAAHAAQKPRRQAGHFAGIPFDYDKVDASKWQWRLPSPADTNMAAEMAQIEAVLTQRARSLGADIRYGVAVDGFTPSNDDVVVRAGDQIFRARWLVGCDGGRSIVRKQGSFSCKGSEPEFTGYSMQVDIENPDKLRMGRVYTPVGMYFQSQPGTIAMVEFDDGAFHRTAPVTLQHVQAVLRRISETDVRLTALHMATTWTDRAQQATTYRQGRVLLAGDAAHIHSPLGGQGLNLGLGDAMNLGWKLAATIHGDASDDLLDSYSSERYPIGASVLDWSRAQVALMRPSQSSRALEGILRDIIDTRDGATYFAERVWGVAQRYDLGGHHPLVGRSVPDFELLDGSKLGELLRDARGMFLSFGGHQTLRSIGQQLAMAIPYAEHAVKNCLGLRAILIRPDGVVAWICDGEPDVSQLIQALSCWLPNNVITTLR